MKEAYDSIIKRNYDRAIELYEQEILENPSERKNYGYLGLALLLQGKETEAQIAWSNVTDEPEEFSEWVSELVDLLNVEAERYASQQDYPTAWQIRINIAEIFLEDIYNLSELTRLSLEQELEDIANKYLSQTIEILENCDSLSYKEAFSLNQLIEKTIVTIPKAKIDGAFTPIEVQDLKNTQITRSVINLLSTSLKLNLDLVKLYLQKINEEQRIEAIKNILIRTKINTIPNQAGVLYSQACLSVMPDSFQLLTRLVNQYQDLQLNLDSVKFALIFLNKSETLLDKTTAYYSIIRGYMNSGAKWQEALQSYVEYQSLMEKILEENSPIDDINHVLRLPLCGVYSFHLFDLPESNRRFMGRLGDYYQSQIRNTLGKLTPHYRLNQIINTSRKLRIGYISQCIRRHSVGWLSRWLLTNHDLERFDIYVYSIISTNDNIHSAVKSSVTQFYELPIDDDSRVLGIRLVAEQIQNDQIDILVDLDSLTSVNIAAIVALKPAPIQVTWLGSDASGIPAIDYFLADPYVLPQSAESYYNSKIWRLPETYLGINGFEIGVPNLRREDLLIPDDAIIYLCIQAPHKLSPEILKAQMQILQQVPNSFLLIKNMSATTDLENYILEFADRQGISANRIRFLPTTLTEEIHRANLAIADVILDAYPYNGATTNLEALWMEIPIVTRVGDTFVSRNGYTFMINAGIEEGIAWSTEEYVDWGVKLGNDPLLRQQISLKIKQSKKNATLWNAKKFARQVEYAYTQMWQSYLQTKITQNIDSSNIQAYLEAESNNSQAIILAQQGQIEPAITLLKKAIELNPEYIDAYYNLGNVFNLIGELDQAIENFEIVLQLNPEHSNALYNLGIVLMSCDQYEGAIASLLKVLEISPFDLDTHIALGNAFFETIKLEQAFKYYRNALRIDPKSASAHCSVALVLSAQGNRQEAISYLKKAIDIDPSFALAYCNMACTLSKFSDRLTEAIHYYQMAIELDPSLGESYWNLTNILNTPTSPIGKSYKLQKQLADQSIQACANSDYIRILSNYITIYSGLGLSYQTQEKIIELERLIFSNSHRLTKIEVQSLYNQFIFTLTSLRDGLIINSNLFALIGKLYVNRVLEPIKKEYQSKLYSYSKSQETDQPDQSNHENHPLRIGFLSSNFRRHPIGWCGLDVIKELSLLTPYIYLYSLETIKPDEKTREFEKYAKKVYFPSKDKNNDNFLEIYDISSVEKDDYSLEVIRQMQNDCLDVLIDLDSVTVPINVNVIYQQPAKVCISWLGFDAPYVNSQNYWLGDWHTHPQGVEPYYVEKLIRLPDSHMAVSGFEAIPIDRESMRTSIGISHDQIVYLYAAPARKFNLDSVKAQIEILNNVPNSILMHRGSGDFESLQSVYMMACEQMSIDFTRIKFMIPTKTEEEHRSLYSLADVYLDAYPYNGGSHNLEALWFNLPVVTRRGEQSFARMGYSFIQSVGLGDIGIANNWEEYIEWAVKLGLDSDLRNSVKEHLVQSKLPNSLAPLWNPKKLAQDMYNLLEEIVSNIETNNLELDTKTLDISLSNINQNIDEVTQTNSTKLVELEEVPVLEISELLPYKIVMVVSGGLEEFIENTIKSIQNCHINPSYIEIFTPKSIKLELEPLKLRYSIGKITAIEDIDPIYNLEDHNVYHDYATAEFGKFTFYKWLAIKTLLEQGYQNIIYTDVDITWRRNPIEILQTINQAYDLAIQTDGPIKAKGNVKLFPTYFCTGFMSFANTEFSHQLLNALIEAHYNILNTNPKLDDQVVFNGLINENLHILRNIFPLSELMFANGLCAKIFNFSDNSLSKIQMDNFEPMIFHANHTTGLENKKKMLQITGNWLLS